MMTQSVMTQAANFFPGTTGTTVSKGRPSAQGFEMVMNNNLKVTKETSNQTSSVKKDTMQTKDYERSGSENKEPAKVETKETKAAEETRNADKTNPSDKKVDTADQKVSNQSANGNNEEAKDVSEEENLAAQILGMLQSIQQAVMEVLKLSPEQLEQMMADQGLSITDLTNPNALKQLVLQSNGQADVLAFLTDEKLADTMNQLIGSMEAIKQEVGLDLSEEQMKLLLAKHMDTVVDTSGTIQATVAAVDGKNEAQLNNQSVDSLNKTNTHNEETNSVNESKVSIEVMKLSKAEEGNAQAQADTGSDETALDASKQFELFLNNLSGSSQETRVDFAGETVRFTEIREIANQIVERIKVVIKPEQTSMELQLNPEHLGKVNLTVEAKNGAMTAQFVVQNEIAKEAIEAQMHTLRETLNNQGIKVEAIEVTVASYAFDQNSQTGKDEQQAGQKKSSGHKISLEDAVAMTETPENQDNLSDITGLRGSNIDTTA